MATNQDDDSYLEQPKAGWKSSSLNQDDDSYLESPKEGWKPNVSSSNKDSFSTFLNSVKNNGSNTLAQQDPTLMTGPGFRSALSQSLPMAAALIPGVGLGDLALGEGANALSGLSNVGRYALNKLGSLATGTGITTASSELDPNNKNSLGQNLQNNLIGNSIFEGAGAAGKGILKGLSYAQPQKYAEGIVNNISGGQNLANNARIFAQKIKNGYDMARNEGQKLYDTVFNNPGVVSNRLSSEISQPNGYLNLDKNVVNSFTPTVEESHNQFIANPTLLNAHKLRSDLDDSIRDLADTKKKSGLTREDDIIYQNEQKAHDLLTANMNEKFDKIDPNLRNSYSDANQNWVDNVVPYRRNAKIRNIVDTRPENLKGSDVKNISNEFENPDENMQKIANDIGPSANNHIMADKLGQLTGKVTPEKLISTYNDLKNKGYSQYITPEMEDVMHSLSLRQKAKVGLQAAPGVVAGIGFGHHFGLPGQIIEAPFLAGASMAASKGLQKLLPKTNPFANVNLNKFRNLYQGAGRTAINSLNSQ